MCSLMSIALGASSAVAPLKSDNQGYVGDLSFQYGFNNCYGTISLAFGNEQLKAISYLYEGQTYSAADLGLGEFKKGKTSGLTISAEVFEGERSLGRADFKNVTFFSGVGCFSETYPVIEMLSLKNSDYKENFKNLSLRNISLSGSARNYKVEELIIAKKRSETPEKKPGSNAATTVVPQTTPLPTSGKPATANKTAPTSTSAPVATSPAQAAPEKSEPPKDSSADIKKAVESQQAQFEVTKSQAAKSTQEASSAAGGFAKGISGTGDGFGFSFLTDNANDSDSPFSPVFIGLVFGKASDPTIQENTSNFLSGVEFQAAFNTEWFGSDPEVYSYNKYKKNNRRWEILLEGKFFTNITAFGPIQPYLALGYASHSDFDTKNKSLGNDWSFTTGYGLAFVGANGIFSIGINQDIKALDISFIFHQ